MELIKNHNYALDGILVMVKGDKNKYPLLKTSEKSAYYMKEDTIKRVRMDNVVEVIVHEGKN